MSKWDDRYLRLADEVASWSKDPSLHVGAVIVREDNSVASVGFNGFPRGIRDDVSLLENREEKLARVIHAEVNAVLNAHERVDGCTVYVTHPPCSNCASVLIQAGIREVVTRKPHQGMLSRWGASLDRAVSMLSEAGVHYVEKAPLGEFDVEKQEPHSEGAMDS